MDDDELFRDLERVGARFDFGEYEARAYVTVLQHGSLTAAELAEKADIPQPRIYDTVRSLADNGLVDLHESRPMRVVAVDPERAFTDVQSTLDDLVETLSERFRRPSRSDDVVSLVKSRQTVLRYLEDVIESAEYELVLALTPDLLGRFESELRERRNAGVTVELLVAPEIDTPSPDSYDYAAIATEARTRRGVTTPVVAVADGTYSVYTPQTAVGNGSDESSYGVIFDRSELGFLVSAFLNTVVWPSSKSLVSLDGDRPFPRRYSSVRRCVEDLRGRPESMYATVRGRSVESGEYTTLSGKITELSVGANRETAAITIDRGDKLVDVGGQLAALEDVEAYEVAVDTDSPPPLDPA